MCGIAAIYAYANSAPPVNPVELTAVRDHMSARGPDGKGQWLDRSGRVGMAHRRLSIIDLSEKAAQPMRSADGNLVISYNGEIYNFQALRQQLQAKGYVFQSGSDTEVLLQLYQDKGDAMVCDLRGMFAFALWDEKRQAMLLARDSFGIKPLYYADNGSTVRIASQVKALLTGDQVSRDRDPAGIVGFYLLGSVPEPYTTYAAIKALPAGSMMWITGSGPQLPKQYFSAAKVWARAENNPAAETDVQQDVRDVMLDTVRHHLVADVPVAVFLSAGVDSGAILGLMRELKPDMEIQTITLAFEEFQGSHDDESPLAAQVAQQYGAKHSKRIVTRKEFETDLPAILHAMDQPSIDGINSWFVSKAASELGVKVALSGLGGDELFGGYPSFQDVPRWQRYFRFASKAPWLGRAARIIGARLLGNSKNAKAAGLLEYAGTYAGAWMLRRGIYMPWELSTVLPHDLVKAGLARLEPLDLIASAAGSGNQQAYSKVASMESSLYMRNQLLRDVDWAGMAHSVEIRVPLVDATLLQNLAPRLVNCNRMEGKTWLGNSPIKPLPDEVINRKKTGFTTPVHHWMLMQEGLQGVRSRRQHWSRIWALDVAKEFKLSVPL